jgi:murein DD-endopeptidase MepM/ murein hydrolase activator NlpD
MFQWAAVWLAVIQFGCDSVRDTLHKSPEGEWAMTEFDRAVKQLRPESERVMAEFDRYAKMADELRKNHESDLGLDEKGVQEVLRRVGIGPAPPTPRPGTPAKPSQTPSSTPPKPFPVPVYSEGYRWPLEAGIVSSEFGQKRGNTVHRGIDIAAELRVPVYAAGAGEVLYAGDKLSGYGNVVILRHDQKTTTLYGHNSELKVRTGQEVKADQVVALLGSTGHSTGPHVHFEIRQNESPANPRSYLPKSRF